MSLDYLNELEERLSVIEFKLELVLKLAKVDINLVLEDCKTMFELAFVLDLNKVQFNSINELLKSQIKFYQSCRKSAYINTRPVVKFDDVDIFSAYSKEEFENTIWEVIPKFSGNTDVCKKIAKINGIQEMYYDQLADEIRKTKKERMDYVTKLITSYHENRELVDQTYQDILTMKQELEDNLQISDTIINFFKENELVKISIFYNSILWEKENDDKKVVINENSYIRNVCVAKQSGVLEQINKILKDKKHECNELFSFLLNSVNTSSTRVNSLLDLYKRMLQLNTNDFVLLNDILTLKQELIDKIKVVDDIYHAYQEYINSIK